MAAKEILLLGNPGLFQNCAVVTEDELESIKELATDLHDTMQAFREKYNFGRAIAAPQIGVMKRVVYMNFNQSKVFINPVLSNMSTELISIWDSCMSFPELLVRVRRHKTCQIKYRDLDWNEITEDLEGDYSELLQHECDHLDGILTVQRAINGHSFALRSQREYLEE